MVATTTPTADLLTTSLGDDPGLCRLYDNVQSEVPAITLSQIKLAAWNTVEQFYIDSTWRREHLFWQMPDGTYAVEFDPFNADWHVAWILSYTGLTNGKVEPPGLLKDVQYPQARSLRSGEALVALKPRAIISQFDPLLWQQWFDTILSGTLSRLYGQPAKPYSSPQLAMFHAKVFRAGIRRARAIAQKSYTDGPGRWCFPYFAGGRRKS